MWERNLEGRVADGSLTFVYEKDDTTEMIEFSLFPPFMVERIWENVEKFMARRWGSKLIRMGVPPPTTGEKRKGTEEENSKEAPENSQKKNCEWSRSCHSNS